MLTAWYMLLIAWTLPATYIGFAIHNAMIGFALWMSAALWQSWQSLKLYRYEKESETIIFWLKKIYQDGED